ncbi:serine palmitoyltransferase [Pseudohyphozyma bogoriensis]|nr:serine palmitoyltransferase [Pseudohyphozyma bogoriensis]
MTWSAQLSSFLGTLTTLAFGAAGGYIAGNHELIAALRLSSHSENYSEALSPPVVSQIIISTGSIMGPEAARYVPSLASLPARRRLIDGKEGKDWLKRLAFNCRNLSGGLKKLDHRIIVVIVARTPNPDLDDVGGLLGLKLSPTGPRMHVKDVIREGVVMVRESERV